jgi:hypothetical protein
MYQRCTKMSRTASSPSGKRSEHVSKVSKEVGDSKFTIRWEEQTSIKGEQRGRRQQVHHQVRGVNVYQSWAKKSQTASSPLGKRNEHVSKVSKEVGDSKFTIRWEEQTCIKIEQRSRGQQIHHQVIGANTVCIKGEQRSRVHQGHYQLSSR